MPDRKKVIYYTVCNLCYFILLYVTLRSVSISAETITHTATFSRLVCRNPTGQHMVIEPHKQVTSNSNTNMRKNNNYYNKQLTHTAYYMKYISFVSFLDFAGVCIHWVAESA